MRSQLETTLKEGFGLPVRLQGSLAPDEAYPERFFTIWNDDTEDGNHYDNRSVATIWTFSVFFYSTDPDDVLTTTAAAIELLKAAGWKITGKGRDAASDEPTHTGRYFEAAYLVPEISRAN